MSKIQYVGRVSPNYFGKFLSEISKNIKLRGKGRIVVKESEVKEFTEPSFYILDRVEPLLSDETETRCRAWGRRIYRGHDFGVVLIQQTHLPDWRLVSSEEAEGLVARQRLERAPVQPITCTASMPPLLGIHLIRNGRLPDKTMLAIGRPSKSTSLSEVANRLLLLTKHSDEPMAFLDPIEPTTEEQSRIHPPYMSTGDPRKDLFRHRTVSSESYLIRRADTPGLFWKVILGEDKNSSEFSGQQTSSDRREQRNTNSA